MKFYKGMLLVLGLCMSVTVAIHMDNPFQANSSYHKQERETRNVLRKNIPCVTYNPCENVGYCKAKSSDGYWCDCYKQYYEPKAGENGCDPRKPKLKDHCNPSPCKNGGNCIPVWGNFFCECPNDYTGYDCNQRQGAQPVKRTTAPTFVFDPDATTSIDAYYLLYLKSQDRGDDFSLSVSTGEGLGFTRSRLFKDEPSTFYSVYKSKYIQSLLHSFQGVTYLYYFPYTLGIKDRELSISVTIKNGNVIQFSGKYFLRVTPNHNLCIPTLKLEDCWTPQGNVPSWKRNEDYIVRSRAEHDCAQYGSHLSRKWAVHEISDLKPVPDDTDLINVIPYDYPQENDIEFHVWPFSLDIGKYAVRLIVSETIVPPKDQKKVSHYNAAVCWFYIELQKPVIKLVGGDYREVGEKYDFVVDARTSYDPNMPKDSQNLKFSWECEVKGKTEHSICKGLNTQISTASSVRVPTSALQVNEIYTFDIKVDIVHNNNRREFSKSRQKVKVIQGSPPILNIVSLMNCGENFKSNLAEVLSVKVVCEKYCTGSSTANYYLWDISSKTSNKIIDWDKDTQTGNNMDRVILHKNVLEAGAKYQFKVTGGMNYKSTTYYTITVNSKPEKGTCKIDPVEGYSVITKFAISCSGFEDEDGHLRYEVYQSVDISESGYGVLVYYGTASQKKDLSLMEGKGSDNECTLTVKVNDIYGVFVTTNMSVKVKPMSQGTSNDLETIMTNIMEGKYSPTTIPNLEKGGDMSGVVRLVTSLVDVVPSLDGADKQNKIRIKLINILGKIPQNTVRAITQVASALQKIVKTNDIKLQLDSALQTVLLSKTLSDALLERVKGAQYTPKEVKQIALCIMSCTSVALDTIPPFSQKTDDYAEYIGLTPEEMEVQNYVHTCTEPMVNILNNIGSILSSQIVQSQDESVVKVDDISVFAKVDIPSKLVGILLSPEIKDEENGSGVVISTDLAPILEKTVPSLGVQVAVIQKNPYGWQSLENDDRSDLISINLRNDISKEELEVLSKPLDIFMSMRKNVTVKHISGRMNLTLKGTPDELEYDIPVHRMDLMKGSSISVMFEPFTDKNAKMKVVITQEYRPSLSDLETDSVIIPNHASQNKSLVTTDEVAKEENTWFYLALMPDENTMKSATGDYFIMDYSFTVYTAKCQFWNLKLKEWTHEGCSMGPDTTTKVIHCLCTHLSVFGGSLLVPPNKIDPFKDIVLFLTVVSNPLIVAFMCAFLLFYVLLLLWGRRQDKKDKERRKVTFLEDNIPGDDYAYLLIVYTGTRGSSTTANVGIQLVGTSYKSKPHILASRKTRVLKTASSDCFILCTNRDLGDLLYIQLWHDNTGHRPAWYCRDVVVYDVQTKRKWIFQVYHWLSLMHGLCAAHYVVPVTPQNEKVSTKLLLLDNAAFKFREDHLWISIFTRNPRSYFTRCQRISVVVCTLTLTMLANIMFYGIPRGTAADQMSIGSFTINIRDIMIGVESALVTVPVGFVILFIYRQTAPKAKETEKISIRRSLQLAEISKNSEGRQTVGSTSHGRRLSKLQVSLLYILPTVHPVTQTDPLDNEPVHKVTDLKKQDTIKRRRVQLCPWVKRRRRTTRRHIKRFLLPWWFIYVSWSLCVASTIISSYLIMLYGLSFGPVKSYLWLSALLSSVFTNIFFIEPIKIILISAILTMIFKQRSMKMDLETGAPLEILYPEDYKKNISHSDIKEAELKRKDKIYRPIPDEELESLRKKERKRKKLSGKLTDLILFVVYIVLLYLVVLISRDYLSYYSQRNVENMFVNGLYHGKTGLNAIGNRDDLLEFLNNTLISNLHETEWYNGNETEESKPTADYNTKLLGIARLRQLRVMNNSCEVPRFLKEKITRCNAPFSSTTEDRTKYGVGWRKEVYSAYKDKAKKPWFYQTSWECKSWPQSGLITVYPGGGYIAELGLNTSNSRMILQFLINHNWLDERTRAVMIEFNLYNANYNLFNIVTLLVETHAGGGYVTSSHIRTASLLYLHKNKIIIQSVLFILLLVILLVLFIRMAIIIWKASVKTSLSHFWNVIDLCIILTGFTWIGIFFLRNVYVTSLVVDLEEADYNEFVSFYGANYVDEILMYAEGFLICLSTIRLWKLLHFRNNFKAFELTLYAARYSILGCTAIFLVVLAAFIGFPFIVMGHLFPDFLNAVHCLSSLIFFALDLKKDLTMDIFTEADRIIGPIWYITYRLVCVLYITNMFLTIILMHYAAARPIANIKVSTYNLNRYIIDVFYYYFPKKNRKINFMETNRLRGGADKPETSNQKRASCKTPQKNKHKKQGIISTMCKKLALLKKKSKYPDINENGSIGQEEGRVSPQIRSAMNSEMIYPENRNSKQRSLSAIHHRQPLQHSQRMTEALRILSLEQDNLSSSLDGHDIHVKSKDHSVIKENQVKTKHGLRIDRFLQDRPLPRKCQDYLESKEEEDDDQEMLHTPQRQESVSSDKRKKFEERPAGKIHRYVDNCGLEISLCQETIAASNAHDKLHMQYRPGETSQDRGEIRGISEPKFEKDTIKHRQMLTHKRDDSYAKSLSEEFHMVSHTSEMPTTEKGIRNDIGNIPEFIFEQFIDVIRNGEPSINKRDEIGNIPESILEQFDRAIGYTEPSTDKRDTIGDIPEPILEQFDKAIECTGPSTHKRDEIGDITEFILEQFDKAIGYTEPSTNKRDDIGDITESILEQFDKAIGYTEPSTDKTDEIGNNPESIFEQFDEAIGYTKPSTDKTDEIRNIPESIFEQFDKAIGCTQPSTYKRETRYDETEIPKNKIPVADKTTHTTTSKDVSQRFSVQGKTPLIADKKDERKKGIRYMQQYNLCELDMKYEIKRRDNTHQIPMEAAPQTTNMREKKQINLKVKSTDRNKFKSPPNDR